MHLQEFKDLVEAVPEVDNEAVSAKEIQALFVGLPLHDPGAPLDEVRLGADFSLEVARALFRANMYRPLGTMPPAAPASPMRRADSQRTRAPSADNSVATFDSVPTPALQKQPSTNTKPADTPEGKGGGEAGGEAGGERAVPAGG